jgi:hypothetical protein
MAGKMNFEKIMDRSDSPTLVYIALAVTVGFFLVVTIYALL